METLHRPHRTAATIPFQQRDFHHYQWLIVRPRSLGLIGSLDDEEVVDFDAPRDIARKARTIAICSLGSPTNT